jgi:VanW like protein/Glycosyl transferases group 1
MSADVKKQPRDGVPTAYGAAVFRAKSALFQLKRGAENLFAHGHARHRRGDALAGKSVIAESRTRLRGDDAAGERALEAGKVHNLRLAARRLDGVEVAAGAVFSFWAQVGRAGRGHGYVRGRELREGCIIPSVGGGLCQLSNALYDAALQAGFEIIERHAHTRAVPGSQAEAGRDATVFWNYVDLRWRSPRAFRIEATLGREHLTVRFRGDAPSETKDAKSRIELARQGQAAAHVTGDCFTCGALECFRHAGDEGERGRTGNAARFGRAAFLVDEYWPEFDEYVRAERTGRDLLCLPLDGRRFGKANYAWDTRGFGDVRERRMATALRSLASRRLAAQGAERQRALLRHAERVARAYAESLAFDVTHVTVMQHLLPFLWRDGRLGGRSFDVLMNGLPLERLHETLDAAAALHPESPTLADFRADEPLARAEREALANARRVATPHTLVASLFEERAVLLGWRMPGAAPSRRTGGGRVVFPGPTVGRKGAYEVREAARRMGLRLVVNGTQPEGEDFWRGVEVERRTKDDWLRDAGVVVLPAFVEHRPRRLLEALARGVPVVASTACGLEGVEGVTSVRAGDVEALCGAIELSLARGEAAPSGA